ncbi:MAG TPA: 4'-phosphopantetheinyl transferase superfamily protein [Solirubrobacterales bacterium]
MKTVSSFDRPRLVAREVHVWNAALDDPGWPGSEQLPAPDRERVSRFLLEEPARRWEASRWVLRRVLARYLEVEPAAVELEVGEHGKPRLRGAGGLDFNLSHSGGLALVAVAGCAVGVDIEAIRPDRELAALADRGLPAEDAEAVRTVGPADRPAVFYRAWARHEARLKCIGTGLGSSPPPAQVAVADLDVDPGYAAAVAVAGSEIGPLRLRVLNPGD